MVFTILNEQPKLYAKCQGFDSQEIKPVSPWDRQILKPKTTERNLLTVIFYSGLLAVSFYFGLLAVSFFFGLLVVSFYLLFRAVLYTFVLFHCGS